MKRIVSLLLLLSCMLCLLCSCADDLLEEIGTAESGSEAGLTTPVQTPGEGTHDTDAGTLPVPPSVDGETQETPGKESTEPPADFTDPDWTDNY